MTRGRRGRWVGRAMIALAVALPIFLFLAAPAPMGSVIGTSRQFGPLPVDLLLLLTGGVGWVLGLVWMIRIHRTDPEPDQGAWRYRRER